MSTKLSVKNMVCNRCIKVVNEELAKAGFTVNNIILGEVIVDENLSGADIEKIRTILEAEGFELLEDRKASVIEKIKIAVIKRIQHESELEENFNFPEYISKETGLDYNYLSSLFSSAENITLEHYIILQKIEKVKELLRYGELSLSEIAFRLGYKSVQHLSSQFKSVTGFTASQFKSLKHTHRNTVDNIIKQ